MSADSKVAEIQSAELDLYRLLATRICTKQMIDVGAHHGVTFRPFLGAGWSVVAFEPVAANRCVLAEHFATATNLTIRPEAVSNNSGTKSLRLAVQLDGTPHEYYHSLERIGDDPYHRKGCAVEVEAVSLNDLAARGEIPRHIGFLKIDTEGHDLAVLKGASELICDAISVEFWRDGHPLGKSPSPPESMIQLMAARGYTTYLAICHEGEATLILQSTLAGTRLDAWGNLLFVRPETQAVLVEAAAHWQRCLKPSAQRVPAPPSQLHDLLAHFFAGKPSPFCVDVGAYQGDFTAALLQRFSDARALLVEPTPAIYSVLQTRFANNSAVQTENCALGAERATADFYVAEQPYQNSLLPPTDVAAQKITVPVETLDHLRQSWPERERLDFLKIDAQGRDLRILEGAAQSIARDQPAILVEVIFVPLYERQDSYFEILQFMRERRYKLAGIFHPHTTEDGLLAFADLLFLPAEAHRGLCGRMNNRYICLDADLLKHQNAQLQTACDERLHAIKQLDAALRKRQEVPPSPLGLTARIKRLFQEMRRSRKYGRP